MDRNKSNKIALVLIKLLSTLTIIILAIILGYLVYRGLRYTNQKTLQVVPIAKIDKDFELYANRKSKLDEIDWFTLQKIIDGKIRTLRLVSGVNEKVKIYVDSKAADSFSNYIGSQIQVKNLIESENFTNIEDDKGGLLVIPIGDNVPKNYKKVEIFDKVINVNKDVISLRNNIRLSDISIEQLDLLKNGNIKNWSDIGGPNLPVNYIDNSLSTDDFPGSFNIISASQYNKLKNGSNLKVIYKKSGWNISLDYLLTNAQESGEFGGILSIILNTLVMILIVLLISAPIGIGSAIYLSQYARKGRLSSIIRVGIDLLSGIPSIIFGLFGMLVFVQLFGFGFSLISGCLTLSLMILPTIIRTSEESINSVDNQMIFASRGLGATKIETIFKIVLPSAKHGILTGVILALGRALGETAALVFTIGSSTDFVSNLTSSSRVLAQHIYLTIIEGQSIDKAFAAALQLILLELIINLIAKIIMNKGNRNDR